MNKIRQKLTSQSGASITYALLLFLVCAVVSSVVLAAATAASGRMSKAVENDQRYYAVASAAELLRKKLDHASHVIEWEDGKEGDEGASEGGHISDGIYDVSEKSSLKLDKEAFPRLDTDLSITEYASAVITGVISSSTDPTRQLSMDLGNDELDELAVTIKETFDLTDSDLPIMELDVSNKDTSNGVYTLRLKYTAGVNDVIKKKKTSEGKIITVKKDITWDFYSLETFIAAMAQTSDGGNEEGD